MTLTIMGTFLIGYAIGFFAGAWVFTDKCDKEIKASGIYDSGRG